MWGLISSNFFYATGHQATIPNIRWEAAFVGFHGDHNYYAFPALLITFNTFAAHILSTVSLPLLLFWPHFRANILRIFDKNPEQKSSHREFELHEDSDKLRSSLFKLILSHILFHLCKVCGFSVIEILKPCRYLNYPISSNCGPLSNCAPPLIFQPRNMICSKLIFSHLKQHNFINWIQNM